MSAGRPTWWTGHDRLGPRRDRLLGRRGIEVAGARVDVGEHRRRAAVPTALAVAMNDSDGHDHLVAGPTPDDVEREVQRGRAVRGGDRVRAPDALARTRPRTPRPRALGDPAGRDHLGQTASASPSSNLGGERDLHHGTLLHQRRARRAGRARAAPPRDELAQALLELDLGAKPRSLAGGGRVGETPRHRVDLARRAVTRPTGRSP